MYCDCIERAQHVLRLYPESSTCTDIVSGELSNCWDCIGRAQYLLKLYRESATSGVEAGDNLVNL